MYQQRIDKHVIDIVPDRRMESENRQWGKWTVLGEGPGYKVKLLEVAPGHRLSLQYHRHRYEHWVVISGTARVVLGDEIREMGPLQSAVVPVKMVHRIENPFSVPVVIVEVQQGPWLDEDDIVRLEDDYHRVATDWRNKL